MDIGNEGSAFVEVLLGRSSSPDSFEVLLGMSTFMTPTESKQWTSTNRVRMFGENGPPHPHTPPHTHNTPTHTHTHIYTEHNAHTHTHRTQHTRTGKEKFAKSVYDQKWDRVKIVCTQPYNKVMTNIVIVLSPNYYHNMHVDNTNIINVVHMHIL